jgi:hypothetical protein
MPATYPYVTSSGPLSKAVEQLRRSFPPVVNATTLKKLGIAPNNESYVINTLRFISLIDEEGKGTEEGRKAFAQHSDDAFANALDPLLKSSYKSLFELHGDGSWTLGRDELITFFRNDAASSALVGKLQANTFATLASFAGHGQLPVIRTAAARPATVAKTRANAPSTGTKNKKVDVAPPPVVQRTIGSDSIGLSVRVEINLPATNDQDVYDKIFRSLRANLIDAPTS